MNPRSLLLATAFAGIVLFSANAKAGYNTVTTLPPEPASSDPTTWTQDQWLSYTQGAATIGIQDLTGAGGNLETAQPSAPGALKITTSADNNDYAEVGLAHNFGSASTVLTNFNMSYSYYKGTDQIGGGNYNAFAAPSIALSIQSPTQIGYLIYEPYWNGTVVPDQWSATSATASSGLWWWTGGFSQANGGGGPPVLTLSAWNTLFGSDADYVNASVTGIFAFDGTYNGNQTNYFDNLTISSGTYNETFDFQAVPEASTWVVAALAGIMLGTQLIRARAFSRKNSAVYHGQAFK